MVSKVIHGFPCVNEGSETEETRDEESPTFASQLNKLVEAYNEGMRYIADGRRETAVLSFESVLTHPSSIDARRSPPPEGDPLHTLLTVCQAALKLKGELIQETKPFEAFECWKEAFRLEPTDVVLCGRLAQLALEIGYVAFARYILERTLDQRPDHLPLKEPLIEVCLEVQEYEAAVSHAESLLAVIPTHRRAQEIIRLHERGDVLLQPKIRRRVDWEAKPENLIHRWVPSCNWSSFIRALCEILDGSHRVDAGTETEGAILIYSLNSHWDMLANARICCEIRSPQICSIAPNGTSPQLPGNSDSDIEMEQETRSRFPLRSRVSTNKGEDLKIWNVMQMMQNAFPQRDWESITSHLKPSPSTDIPVQPAPNSAPQIAAFLEEIGATTGVSPLFLATSLLEHRLKDPIQLEEGEAVELCALDGLIGFVSSPFYSLAMGELLLDAAIGSSSADHGLDSTKREDRTLQRCQKHLFKCIEHKFLQSMPNAVPEGSTFLNPAFLARLYWALGKLQLMEGRCHEAEKALETAQYHCHQLQAPLRLTYLKTDGVISLAAIRAKLLTCLYHDIIETLPDDEAEPMSKELYQDMCTLLFPVLFPVDRHKQPAILLTDYRYRGLCFLQEASKRAQEVDHEFLCHLHLLSLILSTEPVDLHRMEDYGAASSELPIALQSRIECLPASSRVFVQIMRFVIFVFEQIQEHPYTPHLATLFPSLQQPHISALLKEVLLAAMQHLEWCFWRFSCHKGGDSASKEESRKRALHESAALVFLLTQLDPVLSLNAETMGNLGLDLFDLLAEREAVCIKRATFIKNITLHLLADRYAAWVDFFLRVDEQESNSLSPVERQLLEANVEEQEDIQNSIEALIDGVSHFLKCLYRVELVCSSDSEWKGRWVREGDSRDQLRKSDLPQLWNYLSPCLSYLESREGDLNAFNKLKGLVTTVMGLVVMPSEETLTPLSLQPIFDVTDTSIDIALATRQFPALLKQRIAERDVQVAAIDQIRIHEHLYYYYCLSMLSEDMDWTEGDGILGENSLSVLEGYLKWMKLDLCFNPDRQWTWECLGIHCKDATESFLSTCISDVTAGMHPSPEVLQQKWEGLLCRQRRCFIIAEILAEEEKCKDSFQYDQEMLIELEWLQINHSNLFGRPLPESQIQICQSVQSRLQRLIEGTPTPKWHWLLSMGKVHWKLKHPGWQQQSLEYFSKAVVAAQRDEGGLIDPFYKLHAARLKLMMMDDANWELLLSHMFDPRDPPQDVSPQNRVFDDARAALEFCRSKMSGYHRVHYRLALGFLHRGNLTGALSFIQQLFVKGKKKFCIVFAPIDPRHCKSIQRAAPSAPGIKISGSGVAEPTWKFADCVKKYLKLYLKLLYLSRDVETLGAVTEILSKGEFDGPTELKRTQGSGYKYPCLIDMPQRALGMKLLLIHDAIYPELPLETAQQIGASLDSILNMLFHTSISDANYVAVSHVLDQFIQSAFHSMQTLQNFSHALCAGALETLCDAHGRLDTEVYLKALESVMSDHLVPSTADVHASVMLTRIALYASIYPMFVLRSREAPWMAKLSATAQHRSLKTDDPYCKRLLQEMLFVLVQSLFLKAEDIRVNAPTSALPMDVAILEVVNQTCQLIKQFHEALHHSRFLCLRLMHVMRDVYDAMCALHGVDPTTCPIEPSIPLKTQSQAIQSAIQEMSRTPKAAIPCIDLTMEEEVVPVQPPIVHKSETPTDAAGPSRLPPPALPEPPQVPSPQRPPPTVQQAVEMDTHKGAFANAFQQFMECDDDSDD